MTPSAPRMAGTLLAAVLVLAGCSDPPTPPPVDVDGDGWPDVTDPCIDADGDGFGRAGSDSSGCVDTSYDCDDDAPQIHPAAAELCDGLDNDCDEQVDEGHDADQDGWTTCGADGVTGTEDDDCDDLESHSYPGAQEIGDGKDNDCDGLVDNHLPDYDDDGDGHTEDDGDCDDGDATVFPHATEVPYDSVDQNCDGLDYCEDLNCDGWTDLVFSNQRDDEGAYEIESTIYWGGEAGYSAADRLGLPTRGAYGNAIADLDGDGYLDLIFSSYHDDTLGYETESLVYWGGADGFSESSLDLLPTTGAHDVTASDLDEDGYIDLVFSNHTSSSTYLVDSHVYWGSVSGFDPASPELFATSGALGNTATDVDQDGFVDIVVSNYHDDVSRLIDSYLYWGSAGGYGAADRDELPTAGAGLNAVADLDADGYADVVFASTKDAADYHTESYIFRGSDTGFDTGAREELPTVGPMGVALADLDSDGHMDILFAQHWDGATYMLDSIIYWGTAQGFSESDFTELPTWGAYDVEVADLDGDSFEDVVFACYNDDHSHATDSVIYWGSAFGYSVFERTYLPTSGATYVAAAGPCIDVPRSQP